MPSAVNYCQDDLMLVFRFTFMKPIKVPTDDISGLEKYERILKNLFKCCLFGHHGKLYPLGIVDTFRDLVVLFADQVVGLLQLFRLLRDFFIQLGERFHPTGEHIFFVLFGKDINLRAIQNLSRQQLDHHGEIFQAFVTPGYVFIILLVDLSSKVFTEFGFEIAK